MTSIVITNRGILTDKSLKHFDFQKTLKSDLFILASKCFLQCFNLTRKIHKLIIIYAEKKRIKTVEISTHCVFLKKTLKHNFWHWYQRSQHAFFVLATYSLKFVCIMSISCQNLTSGSYKDQRSFFADNSQLKWMCHART